MSFKSTLLGATFAFLTLTTAASAWAQKSCSADGDCPQGHFCRSIEVDEEEPATCKPGAECVVPDASPSSRVVKICEAKACSADSDCGAGLVCYAQTSTECTGSTATPPCPPDYPCRDAGAPVKMEPTCTTRTTKICAFKWQLPCNTSADCGAGFTCKPTVMGSCSGSAGSGGTTRGGGSTGAPTPGNDPVAPADGGAGAPVPPMCTTTTTFPGWCAPTVTSCTANSDCPAQWMCAESPETAVGSPPSDQPGGTGGRPAPVAPDAGPVTKVCVSSLSPPQRASDTVGGTTGPGGSKGETSNGGSVAPPTQAPVAAGNDAGTAPAASKSGSCAMSSGPTSSGAALALVALGLALVIRRRRR